MARGEDFNGHEMRCRLAEAVLDAGSRSDPRGVWANAKSATGAYTTTFALRLGPGCADEIKTGFRALSQWLAMR